jgi:hypothetical protein
MTQEQLNNIDFSVNTQFRVLRRVKQQYHNDEWTSQFGELVNETKEKIIWDLENFFLLPVYSFNPLTRNFKEEDSPFRGEIAAEVNNRFQNFRQEQNG